MFDLGFQELIIIFVVALLVFGPKKLPEVGRSLGRGIAELKKAMRGIQDTMREEESQLKQELPDIRKPLDEIVGKIRDTEETVRKDLDGTSYPVDKQAPTKSETPDDTGQTRSGEEER